MDEPAPPVCDLCGAVPSGGPSEPSAGPGEPSGELPLAWSTAVESGRRKVFCADCSRCHLRAIEGKLDSEWW